MVNWVPDLILNLVGELLGIIVTVFLVDRLIKNRENSRWKPSKNLFYSKLLSQLNDLIFTVLSPDLDVVSYVYKFENVIAYSSDFGLDNSKRYFLNKLILHAKKLSLNKKIEMLERVLRIRGEISEHVSRSASLIEPELFSSLMELNNMFDRVDRNIVEAQRIGHSQPTRLERESVGLASDLFDIAIAAAKPKQWVESKATFRMPRDEYVIKLFPHKKKKIQEN